MWKIWGLIILLIIVSRESFWFGTYGNSFLFTLRDVVLMLLPVVLVFTNTTYKITNKSAGLLFFSFLMFFFTTVVNGNTLGGPLLMISAFITSLYVTNIVKIDVYLGAFSKIITLLSIFSIIVWGGCAIGTISPAIGYNIIGTPFLYKFFNVFFLDDESFLLRNCSIFREPGVFMIYLNLSLIIELIYIPILYGKFNVKCIVVLFVALLSTFSTGGIVTGALIVFIALLHQKKMNFATIMILFLIGSGVLFIINNDDVFAFVFGKFDNMNEYGSGFTRLASFVLPLNIILDNPFFGVGYNNYYALFDEYCQDIFYRSIDAQSQSTNTFMTLGAVWGTWFLILFLYGIYKFTKRIYADRGLIQKGLFITILLMLCNEAMIYCIPLYIIMFYGLNFEKSDKKISKYKGSA